MKIGDRVFVTTLKGGSVMFILSINNDLRVTDRFSVSTEKNEWGTWISVNDMLICDLFSLIGIN